MSLLDFIAIAMMVFFILKGIFRGFVREIASFVGIVMGVWMAYMFYPQMTAYLKAHQRNYQHLSKQIASSRGVFLISLEEF